MACLPECSDTDADLRQFAELTSLKTLSLPGTQITDAGLAQIGEFTSLTNLQINGTQITDAGLSHIGSLHRLMILKRALWPAQHAVCGICGGPMYRFDRNALKCRNSTQPRGSRCWNRVLVNCSAIRSCVLGALLDQLCSISGFEERVIRATRQEYRRVHEVHRRRMNPNAERVRELRQMSDNLTDAIASGGQIPQLVERLNRVNDEMAELKSNTSKTPATQQHHEGQYILADQLPVAILDLAGRSFDFADLLRRATGPLQVIPVQALDTSQVRAMGYFELQLTSADPAAASDPQSFPIETWLFEPPLHIRSIEQCVEFKRKRPMASLKSIASQTGLNRMTVKRSLDYWTLMQEEGLTTPYRPLKHRPESASRWR